MGNKWTCYLTRSENMESKPWPLLLRQMKRRDDKNFQQPQISQIDANELKCPLMVASWSCICPDSDNIQNSKENVTLFWSHEYTLFLEYNLFGEDNFTLEVSSVEEAFELIEQDNETTEKLYPENLQFKWKRIL